MPKIKMRKNYQVRSKRGKSGVYNCKWCGCEEPSYETNFDISQSSDTEKPKVSVEVLNEEEPRPLTQTVMEFKKKALYGKRIKRIDMAGLKNVKRKKYIKYKYTKPKSKHVYLID